MSILDAIREIILTLQEDDTTVEFDTNGVAILDEWQSPTQRCIINAYNLLKITTASHLAIKDSIDFLREKMIVEYEKYKLTTDDFIKYDQSTRILSFQYDYWDSHTLSFYVVTSDEFWLINDRIYGHKGYITDITWNESIGKYVTRRTDPKEKITTEQISDALRKIFNRDETLEYVKSNL